MKKKTTAWCWKDRKGNLRVQTIDKSAMAASNNALALSEELGKRKWGGGVVKVEIKEV